MTYVVTENCIRCKYMDCVEVCPVDCFYEGENMLVIHPDECIDCGVCEPECPAEAIKPDTVGDLDKWLTLNADYAKGLAEYHREARAAGRCQGMGRQAGQGKVVLTRTGRRRLAGRGAIELRAIEYCARRRVFIPLIVLGHRLAPRH